jgi:hypothetical protein
MIACRPGAGPILGPWTEAKGDSGGMGCHRRQDAAETEDWKDPLLMAPPWREGLVTSGLPLLVVIAGSWWSLRWLSSPAGPAAASVPQIAALGIRPAQDTEAHEDGAGGAGRDARGSHVREWADGPVRW